MAARRDKGEGSVTKRKDGRFEARLITGKDTNGKNIIRSFYGTTRSEALAKMKEVKLQLDTEAYVEPNKRTLGEWLINWLTDYKKNQVRPTTYQSYEWLINTYIIPELGKESIQGLKTERIQKFYREMLESGRKDKDEGLSNRTVRYFHTLLRESLEKACQLGYRKDNPTNATTPPRKVKKEMRVFTTDEQIKLESVLKKDKWGIACLTDLYTGLRLGELLALRWSDVNLVDSFITVKHSISRVKKDSQSQLLLQTPKTEKGKRVIPIPNELKMILEEYSNQEKLEGFGNSDDLVFHTKTRNYIEPRNMTRAFYKLIEETGIDKKNFHSLRHSYASRLLEQNINIKVLQELMGHSSIVVTGDTYGHISQEIKKEASEKLNSIFWKPLSTDIISGEGT